MAEEEAEPEPRVLVVLPDGQVLDGVLRGRRRDPDGTWWYQTTIDVPARAVQPVPGQDYDSVPTVVQDTYPWQIETTGALGDRTQVLHRGDCTVTEGEMASLSNPAQARAFLKAGWATACETCRPDP